MTYMIGVIGGAGAQGRGLAVRFAAAGHTVLVGSRAADRAEQAAAEVRSLLSAAHSGTVRGGSNDSVASEAEIVVLATPWDPSDASFAWLSPHVVGKVVVSCINPLGFDKLGPYGLSVERGSAAEHLAFQLPGARLVGGFHHVAASRLVDLSVDLSDEDILVAGDDLDAVRVTSDLAAAVTGHPGVDAGGLRVCRQLEPWTSVLIAVNRNYRTHSNIAIRNVAGASSRRFAS